MYSSRGYANVDTIRAGSVSPPPRSLTFVYMYICICMRDPREKCLLSSRELERAEDYYCFSRIIRAPLCLANKRASEIWLLCMCASLARSRGISELGNCFRVERGRERERGFVANV